MESPGLDIRQGVCSDCDAMMHVLRACTAAMQADGIAQWNESYPDLAIVAQDLQAGSVLVAVDAKALCGMVTVDDEQPPEYAHVTWGQDGSRVAVIHRLAVAPERQGRGVGKLLMGCAEQRARDLGFEGIRLEAFAANPAAVGLYDALGYVRRGRIQFRGLDFICFERAL